MKKLILFILLSILTLTAAYKDSGLTGIEFLKVTGSARSVALGGGYAALNDVNNMSVNPGLIGYGKRFNAGLNYLRFFQGVNYLGLNTSVNGIKTGGFSLGMILLDAGEIEMTRDSYIPYDVFDKRDFAFIAGYGRGHGPFYWGLDFRLFRESFGESTIKGLLSDAGLYWITPVKGLSAGLSILNIKLYSSEAFKSPVDLKTGLSYGLDIKSIDYNKSSDDFTFVFDFEKTRGMRPNLKTGIEAKFYDMFAARLGYRFLHDTGWLSAGLGFSLAGFTFDYSFSPYKSLGFDNQFSFSYGFDMKEKKKPVIVQSPVPAEPAREKIAEALIVSPDQYCFAPNTPNGVGFNLIISNEMPVSEWELEITKDGRTKRTLKGEGIPPAALMWDGRDSRGNELVPGIYDYRFDARFMSNRDLKSINGSLAVDGSAPSVSITADRGIFSPDNDGYEDTVSFIPSVKDDCGVSEWEITVKNTEGSILKRIAGTGNVPASVTWDGKSIDGQAVPQWSKYTFGISVLDRCSNRSEAQGVIELKSDLYLVRQFDESILINLEGVEFDTAKYEIRSNSFEILDRANAILLRPYVLAYKVKVDGHTDSKASLKYNMTLSSNRAREVMEYFIRNGVEASRLSSEGYGPTEPLYPNDTPEHMQKNRRVELQLKKPE